MAVQLTIPKLGMTMTEATIARWVKSEGDRVRAGEILLVIETEKISYEVEAPADGYLHILELQGSLLPVGARVGLLFEDRTAYDAHARARRRAARRPAKRATAPPGPLPAHAGAPRPFPSGRVKASPLARRLARERGVDLSSIAGSGPGGRVVRADVMKVQSAVDEGGFGRDGSAADQACDVVVIGAGPGGLAAAVRASQLGARVLMVERGQLGGTCVNRGCIPTKSLVETAALYRTIRKASEFGIHVSAAELDWDAIMAKKDDLVKNLRMGVEAVLKSNAVEVIRGEAAFDGPQRIRVGKRRLHAKAFIVATGSRWSPPPVPGIETEGVITTDDLLTMREVPETVAVLGSGPVELEAAQVLLFLGARVTVLEEGGRILPREDREISRRLAAALREQGLALLHQVRVMEIRRGRRGLTLRVKGKDREQRLAVDRILHATRSPQVDELGLEAAGVIRSFNGIRIDPFLRTSQPHILAIGDVTGVPMYSHRASAMGIAAAENALGPGQPFPSNTVPRAYYTHPEVASVGLTEQEARQKGHSLLTAGIPYSMSPRAMMMLETEGAVKVVADAERGEILGVHMMGPCATELIAEAVLAMEMEATVEDLARAVRLHPTLSESLGEAAREAQGRGIHVLR
jgi:dihydrolipoamide dehydrogenase